MSPDFRSLPQDRVEGRLTACFENLEADARAKARDQHRR